MNANKKSDKNIYKQSKTLQAKKPKSLLTIVVQNNTTRNIQNSSEDKAGKCEVDMEVSERSVEP